MAKNPIVEIRWNPKVNWVNPKGSRKNWKKGTKNKCDK